MTFRNACEIAVEALQAFAESAAERRSPVLRQRPMAELARDLALDQFIADGSLGGDALRSFLATYLDSATRLSHPAYMAHQVAAPHPMGAVAALIDAFTNNAMAIYEMGPSAATVEFVVINWMLKKVGWQPSPMPGSPPTNERYGGGVLTHGGSLANLTALSAARSRVAPEAWRKGVPGNLVIVAPEGCHYSIARAAGILGLGQNAIKEAPVDGDGRLDPAKLLERITALRQQDNEIVAVVANACSTAVGLYDPLRAVAEVCQNQGVWLHIDGAHGASALVSERLRSLLDGVEMADSLVWDAHKMLRTPTLCAAVLMRDARDLDQAFHEEASYLFHDKEQVGIDFIHRTVECTKAALGLKVFFALAAEGESGIAAFIDRQIALAQETARYLRTASDIEVAVEPQSNIVCFRMDRSDDFQLQLRKRLTEIGNHYISTTEFRGKRWLRLALMSPTTTLKDVEALIEELRRITAFELS